MEVVEHSRTQRYVSRALKYTFIPLIPKCDKPDSFFSDFRPISLCNLVNKINTKMISNGLKAIMEKVISKEQFGLLDSRHILDVIGATQECLHSIKTKNLDALILKMDLVKAYDKVTWVFLILLQIGVPLVFVDWMMVCIRYDCFVLLINGFPSKYCKCYKGLGKASLYPL